MSYQVLARKWRPRNFQDMVGQEHILRMLSNALQQKRIHHAYLFTGTRGVGKTTLARILAKCLNCETAVSATPCGTCFACKAIDNGQFLDLYEIDAASRTKVEDTRELLDNVLYPPTQGRYKIYLIDEVHMLSNHSFNALLKTLEEPPAHVKFLLATTDPKRLPITILSRCLQFHLKRITPDQIANYLEQLCTTENISNEKAALEKLAKAADGSMRDALSLLDQAIAYGNNTVNQQDVNAMLGSIAQDDLQPILYALSAQNGQQLFDAIATLSTRGPDFSQALDELASMLHKIAMAQMVPDAISIEESLAALVKQISPEDVQIYYQIALLGKRDLPIAPTPQQGFEMTMLRMLAFKPRAESDAPETAPLPPKKTKQQAPVEIKSATQSAEIVASKVQIAEKKTDDVNDWRVLLPKLGLSGMAYALAANCTLEKMTTNVIELALSIKHQPMLNKRLENRIEEALTRYFKQPMQLHIEITANELDTPHKQEQNEQEQKLENAVQTIMQDPKIKTLVEMYDATVEVSIVN